MKIILVLLLLANAAALTCTIMTKWICKSNLSGTEMGDTHDYI